MFMALLSNLGMLFLVCKLVLTKKERKNMMILLGNFTPQTFQNRLAVT